MSGDAPRFRWQWCASCDAGFAAPPEVMYGQVYTSRPRSCDVSGHDCHQLPGELDQVLHAAFNVGGWAAVELIGWEWWRGRA